MRVHHLALRTPDPAALAAFYAETLGLVEDRRHPDEAGIRSVWLRCEGTILMIERGAAPAGDAGWDGAFFAVAPGTGPRWEAAFGARVDGRTASTLYARDPDGNRFGVSSWPEPLW